jgi:hypothetical protein
MTKKEKDEDRQIGELSDKTGMSVSQINSLTPQQREALELAATIVNHYTATGSSVFTVSENRTLAVVETAIGFLSAWQWQVKRPEIISSTYDQRLLLLTPPEKPRQRSTIKALTSWIGTALGGHCSRFD